jgi:hypothetical protein
MQVWLVVCFHVGAPFFQVWPWGAVIISTKALRQEKVALC